MITSAHQHTVYFKITPETYPLALLVIDAPMFKTIPFAQVQNHLVVLQTSVQIADGVVTQSVTSSWTKRKDFKKIHKKAMKKRPSSYTHLK